MLLRNFGSLQLDSIHCFRLSAEPCHFNQCYFATCRFLDKGTIIRTKDFLYQSPRQKSRILEAIFVLKTNFAHSFVASLATACVWRTSFAFIAKKQLFYFAITTFNCYPDYTFYFFQVRNSLIEIRSRL